MIKNKVEVVYALPKHQEIVVLEVKHDATVKSAILASKILDKYPEINLNTDQPNHNKVGIFNQVKSLDEVVKDGDRIEIYRHLLIDPKEVRRKRALKQKEQGVI